MSTSDVSTAATAATTGRLLYVPLRSAFTLVAHIDSAYIQAQAPEHFAQQGAPIHGYAAPYNAVGGAMAYGLSIHVCIAIRL
jgi:hypothetical protein